MTGLSGWRLDNDCLRNSGIRGFSAVYQLQGTIPLYLRHGGSIGDRGTIRAQLLPPRGYRISHPRLAWAWPQPGANPGPANDCCFGEDSMMRRHPAQATKKRCASNENRVRKHLHQVGSGSFRLVIDETAAEHMISHHAIEDVLIPA